MSIPVTGSKLAAFLEALPRADPMALCSPPGLGGLWRIRHVRAGLNRHVLVVHRSGVGLAFATFPTNHGACQNCASRRGAICGHCDCAHCQFDRLCDEHGGPPATRAQVVALRERLRNFQTGRKAVVALDGDD